MEKLVNIHKSLKNDEPFAREPIVIYIYDISDETYGEFKENFSKALNSGQQVIPIVICSDGGEIYGLNGYLTTIMNSPVPVATYTETKGFSAAAAILSMGTRGMRYASPNSTMMIHEVGMDRIKGKKGDIKAQSSEIERLNTEMFQLLSRNCNKPGDYFTKLIKEHTNADWYLNANDMLEHGLIDKICVPKFEVNIELKCKITFPEMRDFNLIEIKPSKKKR